MADDFLVKLEFTFLWKFIFIFQDFNHETENENGPVSSFFYPENESVNEWIYIFIYVHGSLISFKPGEM